MSDFLYSEESFMLKQLSCELIRVSALLNNNKGKALNGELKDMEQVIKKINRIDENLKAKNEHIRIWEAQTSKNPPRHNQFNKKI